VRRLPVLLLITYRPEFEPLWKGLPDVATAALQRLDRVQAETLIEQVTGGRKLPAEVMAQIVAKTDGVPLFVEELTKNVLESGLLVEEPDRFRLDGPLPPLAIPSTLQDSLMARLDRLAAVKEIAQIGAVIGREFSYLMLQAVAGRDEAALRASLMQLEDAELVFRSGEPPAARYMFKHALVQDTAYESLLKSRRQILHRRIAEALRDKFPDVVEAEPELIAEHYTRAGLADPAIVHWGKAGDLALRRSAFKEAIAHLGKAIEMTEAAAGEKGKASEKLKLQASYGGASADSRQDVPEARTSFDRAREPASGGDKAAILSAIAVAQQQKARSFQLHAALSLARLYQSTDRLVEAHDVLGHALEGFSPTPEFPEIAEAQKLLVALAGDEQVKTTLAARERRLKLQTQYGQAMMWHRGFAADETRAPLRELANWLRASIVPPNDLSLSTGSG
jgi:tetratricopeptide (TPR) repeat protein